MLHVSLGSKAGWRWTKPFSVDKEGLQCVEVCAADRQLANLYVRVERSGGCQLMVGGCMWGGGLCMCLHGCVHVCVCVWIVSPRLSIAHNLACLYYTLYPQLCV